MRSLKLASLGVLTALILPITASALVIYPTSGVLGTSRFSGPETSQSAINGVISGIIGTAQQLYKANVDPYQESGQLLGSYQTTFSNSASDPSDALIEYVGGAFVGPVAWLLVKDGNHSPGWYLFNLTLLGWNGTDDLDIQDFWPNGGAISHVTLYGTRVPDEGSSLVLLGLGLGALALFARRRQT